MTHHIEIEALHRQLVEERRRVVEIAAQSGVLPPSNLLAYLANLDGAALAVEAVLEEKPAVDHHQRRQDAGDPVQLEPKSRSAA